MPLMSKFSEGNCVLLRVSDIFSKYAWVAPLKGKKGNTITNVSKTFLNQPKYG